MKTLCEINALIDSGKITSFAQKAPANAHNLDQGNYHGSVTMTNTPDGKEPFYYQVFKLGNGDRQVVAHGMTTGKTYQMIQQGGHWGAWQNISGESAYQTWLDAGNTGNKAAFLVSLKGAKGDKGDFTSIGSFATHAEVMAGVNATKPISPKSLVWGNLMSNGGSPTDKFLIPAKANLNDYLTLGMYIQKDKANALSGQNYPVKHQGILTVTGDGSFVYQTYHVFATENEIHTRTKFGNAWSQWEQLMKISDYYHGPLPTTTDLDNITKLGEYILEGHTGQNAPYAGAWGVLRVSNTEKNPVQEVLSSSGKTTFKRGFTGSPTKWTSWSEYGAMTLSGTTLTINL